MIPSFVAGRCTGEEKGNFMALDLGGTNLRVCQVHLLGGGEHTIRQQKYVVSEELKTGPMRHLCDFIADCVDSFLTENGTESNEALHLGYTFSFPILQTAINRGVLKQWTKGFNCSGAVGKDVTILLQDSFRRKNINVNIAAVSILFFFLCLGRVSNMKMETSSVKHFLMNYNRLSMIPSVLSWPMLTNIPTLLWVSSWVLVSMLPTTKT